MAASPAAPADTASADSIISKPHAFSETALANRCPRAPNAATPASVRKRASEQAKGTAPNVSP